MRRFMVLATLLAFVVLGIASAAGRVTIDDPQNVLGGRKGDVQAAAQRLADAGADVVVMVIPNDNAPNAETYINQRLGQIGVGGSVTNLPGNTVLLYRSPQAGHTALYYVPGFKAKLDPAKNAIFANNMRPLLSNGDTAGGLIAGIDAVRSTLYPPTSPFVYGAVGVAVLGALALVLGPRIRRGRVEAANLAGAQGRAEAARKATGAAIADLGQLVRTARDKAQYDRISYSPTDTQRITELQLQGEQTFAQAQAIFDQAEQDQQLAKTPTVDGYNQVAAAYEQARALVEQAATPLNEAERLRAALDQAAGPTGPTTGTAQRL